MFRDRVKNIETEKAKQIDEKEDVEKQKLEIEKQISDIEREIEDLQEQIQHDLKKHKQIFQQVKEIRLENINK